MFCTLAECADMLFVDADTALSRKPLLYLNGFCVGFRPWLIAPRM